MAALFSLHLRHITYTRKDILSKQWKSGQLPDFATEILRFCHDWLSGQESFMVHTSGSTGEPKPITLSRKQMQASARQTVQALGLAAGDHALLCMNPAYIGGKMMLVRAMEHQLYITALEAEADPLAKVPPDIQVDFCALVPLQLEATLQNPHSRDIIGRMKAVIIGGAPVNSQLRSQLKAVNTPIFSTYGMTETVSHIALQRLNGPATSDYFHAFPEVRLSQDERGCLIIEGEVTGGRRLITNDVVELQENNRFRWIGRADNIINSGGIKIQLEKIDRLAEDILNRQGIKRKLFSWGMPDKRLGQRLVLVMEGTPITEKEKENLFKQFALEAGKYEQPKEIYFTENFIKTSSGKIQKEKTAALVSQK